MEDLLHLVPILAITLSQKVIFHDYLVREEVSITNVKKLLT
jgi:hypothetical protein